MNEKEAWLFLLDKFEEHPKENDYNCGGLCNAVDTLRNRKLINNDIHYNMRDRILREIESILKWFDFDPHALYLPKHQLLRSGKCRQYAEMCDE